MTGRRVQALLFATGRFVRVLAHFGACAARRHVSRHARPRSTSNTNPGDLDVYGPRSTLSYFCHISYLRPVSSCHIGAILELADKPRNLRSHRDRVSSPGAPPPSVNVSSAQTVAHKSLKPPRSYWKLNAARDGTVRRMRRSGPKCGETGRPYSVVK